MKAITIVLFVAAASLASVFAKPKQRCIEVTRDPEVPTSTTASTTPPTTTPPCLITCRPEQYFDAATCQCLDVDDNCEAYFGPCPLGEHRKQGQGCKCFPDSGYTTTTPFDGCEEVRRNCPPGDFVEEYNGECHCIHGDTCEDIFGRCEEGKHRVEGHGCDCISDDETTSTTEDPSSTINPCEEVRRNCPPGDFFEENNGECYCFHGDTCEDLYGSCEEGTHRVEGNGCDCISDHETSTMNPCEEVRRNCPPGDFVEEYNGECHCVHVDTCEDIFGSCEEGKHRVEGNGCECISDDETTSTTEDQCAYLQDSCAPELIYVVDGNCLCMHGDRCEDLIPSCPDGQRLDTEQCACVPIETTTEDNCTQLRRECPPESFYEIDGDCWCIRSTKEETSEAADATGAN